MGKKQLARPKDVQSLPELPEVVREIAKAEGIPITGITILGGRPYVNVSGLDAKMREKAQKENLVISRISVEPIGEEVVLGEEGRKDEERTTFGYRGIVEFFDREGFLEALRSVQNPTLEVIRELRQQFTYHFEDEGWASPLTCEAIAFEWKGERGHKIRGRILYENVRMMASRRASSRAKRLAVGCGLTSIEEIGAFEEGISPQEQQEEAPEEAPSSSEEASPETEDLIRLELEEGGTVALTHEEYDTCMEWVAKIDQLRHPVHARNWLEKHRAELETLPEQVKVVLRQEYKRKVRQLEKEAGYGQKA